jgi:hypothetical protein
MYCALKGQSEELPVWIREGMMGLLAHFCYCDETPETGYIKEKRFI